MHASSLTAFREASRTALATFARSPSGTIRPGSRRNASPALKRLVARSPLRSTSIVALMPLYRSGLEVATYYVGSEALTNAAKYSDTRFVTSAVTLTALPCAWRSATGGARRARPRVRTARAPRSRRRRSDGTMQLTSPPGGGHVLARRVDLHDQPAVRYPTPPLPISELAATCDAPVAGKLADYPRQHAFSCRPAAWHSTVREGLLCLPY